MSLRPPAGAVLLLRRALRDDPAAPAILGDLREELERRARARGPGAARRWYWREAVLLAAGHLLHAPFRPSGRGRAMIEATNPQGLLQDAGYALRSLRRNPGFALFAAAVIALGIGATTSVFSVLKPLILAPLPFDDPHELVWISLPNETGDNSLSAVTSRSGNLRDFRARARSFAGLTGYNAFFDQAAYTLTGTGEPERLVGASVAHDFLEVLGIDPTHGRGFTAEEGAWNGPPAVILSHGFWVRRFDADPSIVGRAITLNETPRSVVGVLPADFDFSSVFSPGVRVDFLLPFPVSDETNEWGNTMVILGRLRPGVSAEAAQAELDAVVAALQEAEPDRWGLGARVSPMQAHLAGPFRTAFLLLAGAAGTVLLIACVNVSNLLLARSPGRAQEVAVRKAMGASRRRLVRQLVLETLAIALAGAALGAGLAWTATDLVASSAAVEIPLLDRVRIDASALLFGTAVAVVTGLAVGLVPALQVSEGGEAAVLRSAARGGSAGRGARGLRDGLVLAEVVLACVLLVAGGLLVRSFQAVAGVDLGFRPEGVVAWQLNPSRDFEAADDESQFFLQLTERVRDVPGIDEAGLIDALPLGRNRSWGFVVADGPDEEPQGQAMHPHIVGPGYLPALGIPLVAGRNFTRDDAPDTPLVVMMNETGARRTFGDAGAALGRSLRIWDGRDRRVVGIVRDVRHLSPELGPGTQVYFPHAQMGAFQTMDLAVRSDLPVEQVSAAVSAALRELDPAMPTREFWTMEATVDRALSARRFTLQVLAGYGALALFLAGLGIYGVLAHSVAERRPEIGIRMALGASGTEIVRTVVGRTLVLALTGIVVGAGLSLLLVRLMGSLLYGVAGTDPVTFVGMALILLAVAGLAGAVPAIRAAHVRGVRALRSE